MPRSVLSSLVKVICVGHILYAAAVIGQAVTGGALPPAQVNSLLTGSGVTASFLWISQQSRSRWRSELTELREQVRKLEDAERLAMQMSAYLHDAAQVFELGREAERHRRDGKETA